MCWYNVDNFGIIPVGFKGTLRSIWTKNLAPAIVVNEEVMAWKKSFSRHFKHRTLSTMCCTALHNHWWEEQIHQDCAKAVHLCQVLVFLGRGHVVAKLIESIALLVKLLRIDQTLKLNRREPFDKFNRTREQRNQVKAFFQL